MAPVRISPIRIKELLNINKVGIRPENILECEVTAESDKYIYFLEVVGEEDQLVCIDKSRPSKPIRKRFDFSYIGWTEYNSVIVNLDSKVLARKFGRTLRILKSEKKNAYEIQMKAHTMREDVEFWKWINKDTIAVLTKTAVYHWSIEGDSEPVKVFDRQTTLKRDEMSSYIYDHSLKWLVLSNASGGEGYKIQLYSVDRKVSRFYQGIMPVFTEFKLERNSQPSILFCYLDVSFTETKLHIIEVSQPAKGDRPYGEKVIQLSSRTMLRGIFDELLLSLSEDFPYTVRISKKLNIIYVLTCGGKVHLYDVESGDCIYRQPKSIGKPEVSFYHEGTNELVVVNEGGQVLSLSIDEEKIIQYTSTISKNPELAKRLATRWNVSGGNKIVAR